MENKYVVNTIKPHFIFPSGGFRNPGIAVKISCSFNGGVVFPSRDGDVEYVGGETHLLYVRSGISFEDFKEKLKSFLLLTRINYYLPGLGLITVSSDEDLKDMMRENYDMIRNGKALRIFLSDCTQGNSTGVSSEMEEIRIEVNVGGKLSFSPSDGKHQYEGGATHLIDFMCNISFPNFQRKLSSVCGDYDWKVKYELPGGGLVSLSCGEDLKIMIMECQEMKRQEVPKLIRMFLSR